MPASAILLAITGWDPTGWDQRFRALASRVVVMHHGKVVEEGPAADLFARPQTAYTRALFAAAFNLETAGEDAVAQ
jgi:microcin C transport system ATP-binding protein